MNKRIRLTGLTLLSAGSALLLYILLHEGGHLIVMLYAGAEILDFSVLGAHVSAVGGSYTNLSDLWLHANGALLPFLFALGYMLLYRKDSRSAFYRIFSWIVCVIPPCSLLAWVILPLLYLQGSAPANDDVTHFLENFSQSASPLWVSAAALCLIGLGVALLIRKGILRGFIGAVREFR